MKIVEDINEFSGLCLDPVVTIGTFDGVHLGHRSVLREVSKRAFERGGTSVALTFEPHPQEVIDPKGAPLLLTTKEEKLEAFASLGIQISVILPFTPELSRLDPGGFVREILVGKIRAKELVIGYNHAFGRDRSGSPQDLRALGRQLGFEGDVVPPVFVEGQPVSSTRIRGLIAEGEISKASKLLGRNYSFRGFVRQGEGIGRKLGFPTANLQLDHSRKLVPPDGVYAVWGNLPGERRAGVLSIGQRSSFGGDHRTIEIYILEFKGNLYDSKIEVEVVTKIRDEIKFVRKEGLIKQIEADVKATREILSKRETKGWH